MFGTALLLSCAWPASAVPFPSAARQSSRKLRSDPKRPSGQAPGTGANEAEGASVVDPQRLARCRAFSRRSVCFTLNVAGMLGSGFPGPTGEGWPPRRSSQEKFRTSRPRAGPQLRRRHSQQWKRGSSREPSAEGPEVAHPPGGILLGQ